MRAEDQLGRESLVNSVLRRIAAIGANRPESRIIAVVGPWGSGKTWVMDGVRPAVGGVARDFNPWLFSDELGLYRGFALMLLEGVQDRKARKRLAKALEYIGPSLKGLSFDLSGSAAQGVKDLHGLGSPANIRRQLSAAFAEAPRQTYVFIDDLDRLTPDELLMMFKLLRLIGDLPGFVYVLAYDEETLLHLMARTDIAHDSVERARNYLEKVVEYKLVLPHLSDAQKESLILAPLVAFGREADPHFDEESEGVLAWRLESLVWRRLVSVRLIERFVEAVRGLSPDLYGEVNYIDWILIAYLRIVEPHALQVVVAHAPAFTGRRRSFGGNSGNTIYSKRVATELTKEAVSENHHEEILGIVDFLFPAFAASRSERNYSHYSDHNELAQRASSPDYFARYFSHELPPDSVSDVRIESLMSGLDTPIEMASKAAQSLKQAWSEDPHKVLLSMRRRWPNAVGAKILFDFLEQLWGEPEMSHVTGPFGLPGTFEMRLLATELLGRATPEDLAEIGSRITPALSSNSLLAELLVSESQPSGSSQYVEWVRSSRQTLQVIVSSRLSRANSPAKENDEASSDARTLIYLDMDDFRAVALNSLAAGRWEPADVLAYSLRFERRSRGEIIAVFVDALVLGDSKLVAALRAIAPGPYPTDWDEKARLLEAMNAEPQPHPREVANYVLSDWEARSRNLSDEIRMDWGS